MSDIGEIQLYLGMCIFEIAPKSTLKLICLDTSVLNLIASAGECQSYRDKMVIYVGNKHLPMWHKTAGNGVEYFDGTAAQCIATDDPRLKEK